MVQKNYKRMMQLIDEVFKTRNDPQQLQVNDQQLKKLQKIHPQTLTELSNNDGPLIWILMIPTITQVMEEFLEGKISETMLLEKTKPGEKYDCIYLCSATTLPEARGKGLTKKLCIDAIKSISSEHPIHTLFVWPFTKEGYALAQAVAKNCKLELKKVAEKH